MEAEKKISDGYPWGHERRFNAFADNFRKIHGMRMQKVSIDAGQCVGCKICLQVCPVKAISKVGE